MKLQSDSTNDSTPALRQPNSQNSSKEWIKIYSNKSKITQRTYLSLSHLLNIKITQAQGKTIL